jgi:hypothetical protein
VIELKEDYSGAIEATIRFIYENEYDSGDFAFEADVRNPSHYGELSSSRCSIGPKAQLYNNPENFQWAGLRERRGRVSLPIGRTRLGIQLGRVHRRRPTPLDRVRAHVARR